MHRRAFTSLLTLGWLSVLAPAEAREPPAPFRLRALTTTAGQATSLAEHASERALVVVVMKGSWCPVCIDQLRRLGALRARIHKLGARVVGVSTDSVTENRRAAEQGRLSDPILTDAEHRVVSALGLWRADAGHPMPAIVVFDRCGAERARIVGRAPGERPEAAVMRLLEEMVAHPPSCGARTV
jgi:peroxiredoxin